MDPADFPYFPPLPIEAALGITVHDIRFPYACANRYGARPCSGRGSPTDEAQPDSTQAIQAAVDMAAYGDAASSVHGYGTTFQGHRARATIMGGAYKTTDTIHLGYGGSGAGANAPTTTTVELRGQGRQLTVGMGGTAIYATKVDRPAINIQGARNSAIRGLSVKGRLGRYLSANNFAQYAQEPRGDDRDATNWHVTALGGAALNSRYAPYAGITIDAYCGDPPPTRYPGIADPAFLAGSRLDQYRRTSSSNVLFEDVEIDGFTVGLCVKPSNADGNADFTKGQRVAINHCTYAVSVCHTQSRNVQFNGLEVDSCHTVFTNRTHGIRNGKFGGTITDLSVGNTIQLFDLTLAHAGPMVFTAAYAESLWRIGSLASASGSDPAIQFHGGQLGFQLQHDDGHFYRGVPAHLIEGITQPSALVFDGVSFDAFVGVAVLPQTTDLRGTCTFASYEEERGFTQQSELFVQNATCGGVVFPALANPAHEPSIRRPCYHLDAKRGSINEVSTHIRQNTRSFGIPWYTRLARNQGDDENPEEALDLLPAYTRSRPKSGDFAKVDMGSGPAGRVLNLTTSSWTETDFMLWGGLPGDLIYDFESDSVFRVTARSGQRITALLLNNWQPDRRGGFEPIHPISVTAGLLYFRHTRHYNLTYPVLANLSADSPVLTHCQRDDGFASYDGDITPGDWIWADPKLDLWIGSLDHGKILARDQTAKTITLDGTPAYAQSRRRLRGFVRQGAANDT